MTKVSARRNRLKRTLNEVFGAVGALYFVTRSVKKSLVGIHRDPVTLIKMQVGKGVLF